MMKVDSKGFTLMEAVIASAIVTSFVVALVSAHNAYFRSAKSDPDKARAVYLAEEKLEELTFARAESFSALSGAGTSAEYVDGRFLRETRVTAADDHALLASVSVSWVGASATSTVSLSTYIADLYGN